MCARLVSCFVLQEKVHKSDDRTYNRMMVLVVMTVRWMVVTCQYSGFHRMRYRKYGSQVYTKLEEKKLKFVVVKNKLKFCTKKAYFSKCVSNFANLNRCLNFPFFALCVKHTRRDAGIQTQIISTDNKPFCLIILLKLTRSHFTDNDTAGSDW